VGRGRDYGGNVNNVQYKSDWNCHFEFPPYNNENILIKIYNKKEITDKFNVMKLLLYMFFKEFHKLMPIYQYLINLS
jgi:hypothetical protein